MGASFTVTGADALARKLTATGARAGDQRATLERVGRETARAITGVPVGPTGDLSASVHNAVVVADREQAVLTTDVPYARYVFGGTRYMDAQPPVIPPAAAVRLAREVNRDIERAQ